MKYIKYKLILAISLISIVVTAFLGCELNPQEPCLEVRQLNSVDTIFAGEIFDIEYSYWAPGNSTITDSPEDSVMVTFSIELPLQIVSGESSFSHTIYTDSIYTVSYTLTTPSTLRINSYAEVVFEVVELHSGCKAWTFCEIYIRAGSVLIVRD